MFINIFLGSTPSTARRVPGPDPRHLPHPPKLRQRPPSCYYGLGQRLMEFESAVCRMEEAVQEGETDWAKLLSSLENARVELENMFTAVALLEIATDKLDMDRFKQLTRRAERALMTRYNSRSIHAFIIGSVHQHQSPIVPCRRIHEIKYSL